MKQFIIIFSCLLLFVVNINAQVTDKINFQMLVRDASGELLPNGTIGIKFQILQGSNTGQLIFEETHSTSTNALGVVSVKIGGGLIATGSLNTINWSNGPYFISIEIDPFGGSNYTLQSTSKLNSVPIAASTLKSALAQTADYNSLTNKPITITSNQLSLLGFLTLSNAIDLNATKTEVDLNTLNLFPGFGTTTGTAFEVLWSIIGNDVFFQNGNVGIGTNANLAANPAVLSVEGGILHETTTTFETEIGAIKYLDINNPNLNDFYYGNNLNTLTFFNSIPDKDIVFINSDVNIISRLGIGESMVPSYNFNNNNFVIASSTPSIRFDDTSNGASFPTADWSIKINDDADSGKSYFSVSNFNTSDSNFKIMAGAPSNAFNILENGNIGLNIIPTAKLEVENTIIANAFIGDASGLTNLPALTGISSTTNIGSTTLIADNNSDGTGAIIFQTKNQNQLSIASNGNVAIGDITPTATLEVDGNVKMNDITAQNLVLNGYLKKSVTLEVLNSTFFEIDISGKSIITMNATGNQFAYPINGIEGQVVSFINSGTNTITFLAGSILSPGGANMVLEQNESVTLVKSGNNYLIVNLVN